MVDDIETQLPNFNISPSGHETSAFPPIVPGPLPAPAKAPVSAWSKPPRLNTPPPERPLDHTKVPKFVPSIGRKSSPSFSPVQKSFPSRHSGNDRDSTTRYHAEDSPLSGNNRDVPAHKQSWTERSDPRVRSSRYSKADTKLSVSGGRNSPNSTRRTKEKSLDAGPARRGLEPIWDTNNWEVITPRSPPKRQSPEIRSAHDEEAANMAFWRRKEEECAEIKAACMAAGEDDPFGGW